MKNKHILFVLTLLFLWAGWWFRGILNPHTELPVPDKDQYQFNQDWRDSLIQEYQPKYDSLYSAAKDLDSIAESRLARAETLEAKLWWARQNKDTIRIIEYQDSIIQVKDTVIVELQLAGQTKDSLINIQHQLINSLDSINNINDSLYFVLDQNFEQAKEDRDKYKKQRNRARLVVGGFTLFEVGRIMFKK